MPIIYEYKANSNETIIENATGEGEAIIPDKVVEIMNNAFSKNPPANNGYYHNWNRPQGPHIKINVTSLIFSANSACRKIGNQAFHSCPIKNITFGQNIKIETDEEDELELDDASVCADDGKTDVESITFPQKLKIETDEEEEDDDGKANVVILTIGQQAFKSCPIESITFPPNIKSLTIENDAFRECPNLNNLTFPQSLTSLKILNDAFRECSKLNSITFPETLKELTILNCVFYKCSIESLNFPQKLECSIESLNFPQKLEKLTIGNDAFRECHLLKSINFNNNVNLKELTIGVNAFRECPLLNNLTFPQNLTSLTIQQEAFRECSKLNSITFPENLESLTIGNLAFNGCIIRGIIFPESLEKLLIGDQAFYGGHYLSSLTFPDTLESFSIGTQAFYACSNLKQVKLPIITAKHAFDSNTTMFLEPQKEKMATRLVMDRIGIAKEIAKEMEEKMEEIMKKGIINALPKKGIKQLEDEWTTSFKDIEKPLSYNTILDKISETNDTSEFMIFINSTLYNQRSIVCWEGFIKSSQNRAKINVRLLNNKYDDIVNHLLHHLNRINPDKEYEIVYIELILNMYMINDEHKTEFVRDKREKKYLHQEKIKHQEELALEQERQKIQQEKENKERKMKENKERREKEAEMERIDQERQMKENKERREKEAEMERVDHERKIKENKERRDKEAELELLEQEAMEQALVKIDKDKHNIKLQEEEIERTKEIEIQLALERIQNQTSKEMTILNRLDRKANDLKENIIELHQQGSDILQLVSDDEDV